MCSGNCQCVPVFWCVPVFLRTELILSKYLAILSMKQVLEPCGNAAWNSIRWIARGYTTNIQGWSPNSRYGSFKRHSFVYEIPCKILQFFVSMASLFTTLVMSRDWPSHRSNKCVIAIQILGNSKNFHLLLMSLFLNPWFKHFGCLCWPFHKPGTQRCTTTRLCLEIGLEIMVRDLLTTSLLAR